MGTTSLLDLFLLVPRLIKEILATQPSWKRTRDVQITTRSFGGNSPAVELDGEDDNANQVFKSPRKISYLPSASLTYSLWYKRRWMTITRVQQQSSLYGTKENTLYLQILTRDHNILKNLLQEARRLYVDGQVHNMCVYVSNSSNQWNHVACRAKRSMRSIVLDPGVKGLLLGDARDFLQSKTWYAERGIPFRRGYLLHGVPGSGKTSMIHCMAGELGLDVYIISLSRAGLDDSSLSELVNALPDRCVALMEDIDVAFTHAITRTEVPEPIPSDTAKNSPQGAQPASANKLSLSGLLNALDGVGAQEGRILFATTNKYSALDPALCRPGRMDLHVEFKNASKYQARELFSRFYLPTETTPLEDSNDEESIHSDFPSDDVFEKNSKYREGSPQLPLLAFTGNAHTGRPPKLSYEDITKLAQRFADAIPEREWSMASLQGYLMAYKTRPFEAADGVGTWMLKDRVAGEREMRGADSKAITAPVGLNPVSQGALLPRPDCTCETAGVGLSVVPKLLQAQNANVM
ncbi:P-loop containing nucleoside triphosphate hydrolase protein [Collybia nuda]|uniref:P-loop containing nucleoside triphosphate hydrolase protein n=1 Tax=Collybia nuda TaxID=64659 RepID=A0A9P5YC08_9AGAR|nr:P-loop containing nucleoside triphosphate hydrolase protein [Collybia nuda]